MSSWKPLSRRVRNKSAFLEMPLYMSVKANAAGRSACAQVKIENIPRARDDYDEEAAYESYMNPEPGFQSGPGDSVDAD